MLERLRARDRPWQLAVGRLMRDAEQAMLDNWAQVERAAEDAANREQRSSAYAPPGYAPRAKSNGAALRGAMVGSYQCSTGSPWGTLVASSTPRVTTTS
jgi:hypothetical protein